MSELDLMPIVSTLGLLLLALRLSSQLYVVVAYHFIREDEWSSHLLDIFTYDDAVSSNYVFLAKSSEIDRTNCSNGPFWSICNINSSVCDIVVHICNVLVYEYVCTYIY